MKEVFDDDRNIDEYFSKNMKEWVEMGLDVQSIAKNGKF